MIGDGDLLSEDVCERELIGSVVAHGDTTNGLLDGGADQGADEAVHAAIVIGVVTGQPFWLRREGKWQVIDIWKMCWIEPLAYGLVARGLPWLSRVNPSPRLSMPRMSTYHRSGSLASARRYAQYREWCLSQPAGQDKAATLAVANGYGPGPVARPAPGDRSDSEAMMTGPSSGLATSKRRPALSSVAVEKDLTMAERYLCIKSNKKWVDT